MGARLTQAAAILLAVPLVGLPVNAHDVEPRLAAAHSERCRLEDESARLARARRRLLELAADRGLNLTLLSQSAGHSASSASQVSGRRQLGRTLQACPQQIEISGSDLKHPDVAGMYDVAGIPSGDAQDHRPIYKNAKGKFLYYWKAFGAWRVGESYDTSRALIASDKDNKCADIATKWFEFGGSTSGWEELDRELFSVIDSGGASGNGADDGHASEGHARVEALSAMDASSKASHHSESGHGHHEEAEGEEEEEHEFHWKHEDLDASIMLLGMISIIMVLFYLTNWPDDDIRLYTWRITSSTISIFCSVLLFSGFDQLIGRHTRFMSDYYGFNIVMCCIHFAHCAVYLVLLQAGTSFTAGLRFMDHCQKVTEEEWVYADALRCNNDTVVEGHQLSRIRAVKHGMPDAHKSYLEVEHDGKLTEIPVCKKRHCFWSSERSTKAMAMLLAHMGGFAAIRAGNSLQQLDIFMSPAALTVVPIIINQVVIQLFFRVSHRLRTVVREARLQTIGSDKTMSDHERDGAIDGLRQLYHMVEEETIEAENDVSSLSMSFLTVNVFRYFITGYVPNAEGAEPHGWLPVEWQPTVLLLCSLGFVVIAVVLVVLQKRLSSNHQAERMLETLLNATGMCSAWCILWATRWGLSEMQLIQDLMLCRVALAVLLTSVAAGMVFLVDKVDDRLRNQGDSEAGSVKEVIRVIINSLGILVGFSWEHCFDGAVVSLSQSAPHHRHLFSLLMGVCICLLVLPAWCFYILQKVMLMEEMMSKKRGTAEHEESHDLQGPSKQMGGQNYRALSLVSCGCGSR